jgi:hypothetical protein
VKKVLNSWKTGGPVDGVDKDGALSPIRKSCLSDVELSSSPKKALYYNEDY